LLALANFMRLSLMKAAHAVVGGAVQEIRIRGPKKMGEAQRSLSPHQLRVGNAGAI
jgi:hypothetical protein